ncbi:MAG: hypothetical protein E6J34_03030 [Chloroflexi bacterium]|nr:MAG: hypothetical protein E6J34_03030 [Chloroflexota bacterium]
MMRKLSVKRWRIGTYELSLLALIILATLLRLALLAYDWPVTNSDEGNMGILARHVAYNGEWPIFFYGLPYMGPVEGYIAAPLFRLFGPSLFSLRVGLSPLFSSFLLCMYYLTRLLYTRGLALFIVALLSFGSYTLISNQLKAVGEYPETVLCAALISFLVVWLALSSPLLNEQARTTWKRIWLYGSLGLVVGLALWVDFLILPFVATGLLFLLLFCRRELRSPAGVALLLGTLLGALPLLLYNATAPFGRTSFNVLLDIHHSGAEQLAALPDVFFRQLTGALLISLPMATGFNPLCRASQFPYFGKPEISCILLQGGWSIGYLALFVLASLVALYTAKRLLHKSMLWTFDERREMIIQCGRLMLLICAGGTLFLFATSPNAALVPVPTSRYLICLLVATPAVLWPLWLGLQNWQRRCWYVATLRVVCIGLLLLLLVVYVAGTVRVFEEVPNVQASYDQEGALVHYLIDKGATRVYSEYWTCNRLIFHSAEQIICSALDEQLKPGLDRYAPYATIVRKTLHPAYVFPLGSRQASAFVARIHDHPSYRRSEYENYVIYLPVF